MDEVVGIDNATQPHKAVKHPRRFISVGFIISKAGRRMPSMRVVSSPVGPPGISMSGKKANQSP